MKSLVMSAVAFFFLTGFGSIGGCSIFGGQMDPKTVQQAQTAVYQIKAGYDAAQKVALVYLKYPRCDTPGALAPFCTKQEIVDSIKRADALAYAALNAAEAAVRAPEFGESKISAVISSARAAKDLFKDITDKLPVKPGDAKASPGSTKVGSIPLLTRFA